MDVSPMSITPADTPSASTDQLTDLPAPRPVRGGTVRIADSESDTNSTPPDLGSSYFRRTSLAIAAARRFTLYETVASTPGSPLSPIAARAAHQYGDHLPVPASPISPAVGRGGVSFGSSFFGGRNAGHAPVRYASPLQESDEEEAIGSYTRSPISMTASPPRPMRRDTTRRQQTRQPTEMDRENGTSGSGRPGHPRRRMSSVVQARYRWLSGGNANTGDEPGVDVRSERDQEAYGHLKGKTHVTVVDYTCDPEVDDSNVRVDFDGERLAAWLDCKSGQRPIKDGKPAGVRWIHVSGLNWEVIKTLTLKYGLHPLAVEDALRSGRSPRSKVDFYANHLYLQIVVYHVHAPDRAALARVAEGIPEGVTIACEEGGGESNNIKAAWKWPWQTRDEGQIRLPEGVDVVFDLASGGKHQYDDQDEHRLVVEKLTASYMVPLRRGIVSIFMLRDGTLISLSAHEIHEALAPIYERLEDEHSLLRRSNDVSMLAHAILDVSVDLSVEITQAFEAEILKAEAKVLVHAQLELVRHLHIIQAQILRFRRQLASLLHACYVLRDQDVQRAQAAEPITQPRARPSVAGSASGDSAPPRPRGSTGSDANGGGTASANATSGTPSPAPPPVTSPGAPPPSATLPPPLSGLSAASPSSSMRPHLDILTNPHHNGLLPAHLTPMTPLGAGAASTAPSGIRRSSAATANTVFAPTPPAVSGAPVAIGWFTPMAKVYMNDVIDHLEMVVSSSEQFVGTCDHLTDYCFNVLSFHTNNSMERLSIVTVVFLPLTFIASYFGMNFTNFPSLENPDSYFWRVAAPCTTAFFIIFSYSYLSSAWETFKRRMTRYRRERNVKISKKHD